MNISALNVAIMSGPPENGFTSAMRKVFTGGYWFINPGHPQFNQELLRLAITHKPDLIFIQVQSPGVLNSEIIKEIAKNSIVIQWSGDCREESPPQHYLDIAKYCHLTLFSNLKDVRACRELGIASEWLECGVDPEIYYPRPEIVQDYDIVAHFNHYTHFPLSDYRWKAVRRLKEEFGSKFDVFGSFPGARSDFNADQRSEAVNYCHTKIAISISNFCVPQYASDRLGRIMASGTPLCLTHSFPMLDHMYKTGRHLISFDDLDDMVFKCRYFLEHEDERVKIIKAGHKHFLENYTFEKMAIAIKDYYNEHKTKIN